MMIRKFLLLLLFTSLGFAGEASADVQMAAVASWTRQANGILLDSEDGSEVAIQVLASDLVRVRANFRSPLSNNDHSWAIAKTDWTRTKWDVAETPDDIQVITPELRVRVRRRPLLIDFLDATTGRNILADHQPMAYDPSTGKITAYKRLGLNEHFYGLGEKAARLDKRRSAFSMWNSDTPGYKLGTDPIYQSIPFYLGWQDGTVYGVFFDNSYRSFFDFGRSAQDHATFGANGGEMNDYAFLGPAARKD